MEQSELVRGIVVDKEVSHPQMPKQIKNARIALLNAKLEIEKTEFDAKINISSPDQMKRFLDEEETMLRDMTDKVSKSGANVIFCEKGIDDLALHFLAKKNIMAIKNISSGDMEKLAKATGGTILASTKDLAAETLGEAKLVEEVKMGDDKLVYVRLQRPTSSNGCHQRRFRTCCGRSRAIIPRLCCALSETPLKIAKWLRVEELPKRKQQSNYESMR